MKAEGPLVSSFIGGLICTMLLSLLVIGCFKFDNGESGSPAIDTGTIFGTVTDSDTGEGITGATVSSDLIWTKTDSSGRFTLPDLPVGAYKLTASAVGYNLATSELIGVIAGQSVSVNFVLSRIVAGNQAPTISIAGLNQVGFGTVVNLYAPASDPDNDPLTFEWSQESGPPVMVTSSGPSASFTTKNLIDLNALEDRFGIVGLSEEGRGSYSIKVVVSDDKGAKSSATASVTSASPSAGIRNVPTGIALYLNSGHADPNLWSCVGPGGACSPSQFGNGGTRTPRLLPDTVGSYTLTEGGNTISITAGTWQGIIGQESTCQACHIGDLDKFSEWANTGHATIFSEGIDGLLGYYKDYCTRCHTVGYDTSASNNGFDDAASANNWEFPSVLQAGNWASMQANYPAVARLANIQCESCHGPQVAATHSNSTISRFESARITFAPGMCAQCHDAPPNHTFMNEWQGSGHANLGLSQEEATWENRGSTAAHCGRCHSGQGFVKWLPQVTGGNPGNITPFNLAVSIQTGLTFTSVQPQTCQACHDPHDSTCPAQVRVYGDTPLLPSGFSASGLGSGALCVMCHNTRNGTEPTSGLWANCNPTGTTYLHEDGDPCGDANVAGTGPTGPATQYSAPHIASQGDVLMGRNAYFMGAAGTPHLSKHSNVAEACVGCHMELNPDGVHVFKIDPAKKPQVCANCHGSTTGEGLKAQVEGLLDQLEAKIGSKIAGVLTGSTLTYTVRAWDPDTGCYSSSSSTNSNVVIVQDAVGVEISEISGQYGIKINLAAVATITWDAYGSCVSGTTVTTTVYAQLGSIKDGSSGGNKISLSDNVIKASWNYYLIEDEQSHGVHNPSFVVDVLWNSIQALP